MAHFLSRLIGWILALAAAVVAIAFAVGNKQDVTVYADPLPFELPAVPLFGVVFAAMFVGILIGGLAAWKRGGRWRRLARQRGRVIADLEAENRGLRAEAATPAKPAAVPALPKETLPADPSRADAA